MNAFGVKMLVLTDSVVMAESEAKLTENNQVNSQYASEKM